jgi:hypothetical protein
MSAARRYLSVLLLLVGVALSPLRAVAATLPMLIPYDAAVGPTAMAAFDGGDAVRPEGVEAKSPAFHDYDGARLAQEGASNPPVAPRAPGVHAYDDALELLERRELAKGPIFDAAVPTAAAEGAETALVEGGEVWNARGGVDFSKSTAFEGQVQIPYTGSRMLDYQAANRAAGLGDSMRAPAGFVWHHLDDYNALTNTGTMQLVDQAAHMANAPHIGGVAQWVEWMGVPYAP